jgi:putative pyruvate formate lyase activating enzyme
MGKDKLMRLRSPFRPFFISKREFEPAYLALYRSGELEQRAQQAIQRLEQCTLCPRGCEADRPAGQTGVCQSERYARVSSFFPHLGEEDCLRGWEGSGTIFFTSCGLRCVFCQNYDISQEETGPAVRPRQLAMMMLELQVAGCHNINLVTPGHMVPQILEALVIAAAQGLRLPLVYNTSGYDGLDSLQLLDGVVDIYLPDFKIWDADLARRYLRAADYPEVARQAIREMHRQVGDLKRDEDGLAKRGVLVRHLVMPGLLQETAAIMQFLAREISPSMYVNVMRQYYPAGKVDTSHFPEINRRLTSSEYQEALKVTHDAGLWRLDERQLSQQWVWD